MSLAHPGRNINLAGTSLDRHSTLLRWDRDKRKQPWGWDVTSSSREGISVQL